MMQQDHFGHGTINELSQILSKHNVKKIFLVTGKGSYESSGVQSACEGILGDCEVTRFSDFSANPKLEEAEEGLKLFQESDYDMIIAVGGGSVMDTAKLINVFASNPGNPMDYITGKKKIENKGKPFVAIPTTSGSGSEATHFAVVYVDKTKYSVAHEFVLPDYAIIDPNLTMSVPPQITASTGMDAFCQAVESYWSVDSTDESKIYSKKAIGLVMRNLRDAVNNPNANSREAMAKASNLAGKAINIAKTTAPHAISYTITSHFGVPHGHAVALTLGAMLVHNSKAENVTDQRGEDYVRETMEELNAIFGVESPEAANEAVASLMKDIGLKTRLSKLGIKKKDLDVIISSVDSVRLKNNPVELTQEDLRLMLHELL